MTNPHDDWEQQRTSDSAAGPPRTQDDCSRHGSRRADRPASERNNVSSHAEPSLRSRTTARSKATTAAPQASGIRNASDIHHEAHGHELDQEHDEGEEVRRSHAQGLHEQHDENEEWIDEEGEYDEEAPEDDHTSNRHDVDAREREQAAGHQFDQQEHAQEVHQPAATRPRSTAPRSHVPSSRHSHFRQAGRPGAAAEYYDPAQSFHTDDSSSCCSSCTGTTDNNHAHDPTVPLLPHPEPYSNGQPPPLQLSQPHSHPMPITFQPPSHSLKPGLISTLEATQQVRQNDRTYHEDTGERVELLRRMDRIFNRGISGKLTILSKRKKEMFLQEAEATAARLRGEQPGRIGEPANRAARLKHDGM